MNLNDVSRQSMEIRSRYHELEKEIHGSEWSLEEDALAFLTDAGLTGRLVMANQGRWPSDAQDQLPAKMMRLCCENGFPVHYCGYRNVSINCRISIHRHLTFWIPRFLH